VKKKSKWIIEFSKGIESLFFPRVCVCCGLETTEKGYQLCSFCKEKRFVDANPDNKNCCSDILLPGKVLAQHALWQFDKGGMLQDLMHYLKYERLRGIGTEMGQLLGFRTMKHQQIKNLIDHYESVMLPVPLHYLKFRKRGFNQAFYISKGLKKVFDIPICSIDAVIRKRNTNSQTGFSIDKRISNVRNAFRVRKKEEFEDKLIIVVDDVFTTGATTFELIRTMTKQELGPFLILTVAQA